MTAPETETTDRETPAQRLFWQRLRRGNPELGERFLKGTYRCPSHDDRSASLGVWYEPNRVHFTCHAGCNPADIIRRLAIAWIDLSDDGPAYGKPLEATYTYTDAAAAALFRKHRYAGKDFRFQHYDPELDTWRWGRGKAPHVLYRLPQVAEAVRLQERVWFTEGEKDADRLVDAGAYATCNPRGAAEKWRDEYTEPLRDAYVTVVADRDDAGRAHAREVYHALTGVAAEVLLVEPAVNRPRADASDHLDAGFTVDDFVPLDPGPSGDQAPEAEPLPQVAREEGDTILKEVEATLRRYVAYPSPHHAVAVALWTAHTHAVGASETTPYLHFTSPEPESGKTRCLEVLEHLTARAWRVVKPSEAVFYRKVEQDKPTVLLDEVDVLVNDKADTLGLLDILNAGYRRGGSVARCVPGPGGTIELADFAVYGPKALAGIRDLPGALASRCIPIRLQRRDKNEHVARFRLRHAKPELTPIRLRLAAWVALVIPELADAEPELPEALTDRQQDCWEPLFAIADAAGGDWPRRAREAAAAIHGRDPAADPSTGVLLLAHIKEAFTAATRAAKAKAAATALIEPGDVDRLPTAHLLRALCAREDGPWAGWWARDLKDGQVSSAGARLRGLLKPYGIEPHKIRTQVETDGVTESKSVNGYYAKSFKQAWQRYPPPEQPPTPEDGGSRQNTGTPQVNGHIQPEHGSSAVLAPQASDQQGSGVLAPDGIPGPPPGSDDLEAALETLGDRFGVVLSETSS